MTIDELCSGLELDPLAGKKDMGKKVEGAYTGDLLSFVMANAAKGNVWITIQAHSNIVAVASLIEMSGIIVAAGVEVDDDTLKKADEEGIPILSAEADAYTLCCKLHSLGV